MNCVLTVQGAHGRECGRRAAVQGKAAAWRAVRPANNQKHNRLQQHDELLPNQGVPDLPAKRQRSVTRRWLHRFPGWSALCIKRSFMQRPQHQCTVCQEAAAAAGADTAHALPYTRARIRSAPKGPSTWPCSTGRSRTHGILVGRKMQHI